MRKIFFLFAMLFAFHSALPLAANLNSEIRSTIERRCCSKIRLKKKNPCNVTCPQGPQGAQGAQGPQGEQGPQGPTGTATIDCFASFYTLFDTSSPDEFGQVLSGSNVPLDLTQANVGHFIPVTQSNGEPPRGETVRAWEVETGCDGIYHVVWGVSAHDTGSQIALTINDVEVAGGEVDTGAGNQTTTVASVVTLFAGDQIAIKNVGDASLELGSANGTARGDNNTAFLVLFKLHDPIDQ